MTNRTKYSALVGLTLGASASLLSLGACSDNANVPRASGGGAGQAGSAASAGGTASTTPGSAGSLATVAGTASAIAGNTSGGTLATAGSGGSLADGGNAGSAGSAGSSGAGGNAGSGGDAPSCVIPTSGGEDLADIVSAPRTLECEDAQLLGSAAFANEGSGWQGQGFADMKGGEGGMVWLVDVPAAGQYGLTFRYTQDNTRDMALSVNCIPADAPIAFNDTNSWNADWAADVTTLVSLRQGINRIELATDGGSGPNFDTLQIFPPICVVSATATTCEAEAALTTGHAGPSNLGSGWSGTGFADMYGDEGAINWMLEVPTAGSYQLSFVYTQDDDRDMTLSVNGEVKVESLAFHDTDNWNIDWAGDVLVEVDLKAGLNSVRLATNGNSGPNFDKLLVTPAGPGAGGTP